jgi:UDP-N-acetylglucosamine diphosphorylase/glucosamine-1-phosphate N-acetyltransferase
MPASHVQPAAIILAAGKGTRMNSDLPKVVHEVGGRPMVCAVVDAVRAIDCDPIVVVVGYKADLVNAALKGSGVRFVTQEPQLGTGHAAQCAEPALRRTAAAGGEVFVLAGDGPLIRAETLETMLRTHRHARAAATLATSIIDDPTGYGRIVRYAKGAFKAIVEHKNCTPDQHKIREINPSYYCFDAAALFGTLPKVERNAASGEFYITDVPALLLAAGRRVEVITAVPPEDVLSINTPAELALVDRIYRSRRAQDSGPRTQDRPRGTPHPARSTP